MERLADLTRTDLQRTQAADLMRWLSAKAFARHERVSPADYFAQAWPTSVSRDVVTRAFDLEQKAAVAAGSTTDANWAKPLMPSGLVAAFMPFVTRQSALLSLPLRRVPFATAVSTLVSDASYAWVGELRTKPVSSFGFDTVTLAPTKTSGIVVISQEVARLSTPGSVPAMQDALAAGLAQFVDTQFLDPTITAIAGERPASVTNGLTPVTAGATLPETIAALVSAFFAALPQASPSTTLIMSPATAGQLLTRDLPNLPIVLTPAAGATVVILDPTRVVTARDEAPVLDTSGEAAVQMDSAPTDPPTAAVVLVSFWQHNLIGIRVEWAITWQALPNSVAYTVVA